MLSTITVTIFCILFCNIFVTNVYGFYDFNLHCRRKFSRLKSTPAQQPHFTPEQEHGRRKFENHPPAAGLAVVVARCWTTDGSSTLRVINGPTMGSSNVSLVMGSKKFSSWCISLGNCVVCCSNVSMDRMRKNIEPFAVAQCVARMTLKSITDCAKFMVEQIIIGWHSNRWWWQIDTDRLCKRRFVNLHQTNHIRGIERGRFEYFTFATIIV